ncbi:MAG: hypothetical protein JEZ11_16210 [Desulfobacterales bacterium]|nr:hypothetical protein [Desulfobacterales bacterium]
MSGIQEILVIVLIILAIFFIPRLGSRRKEQPKSPSTRFTGWADIPGKYRLAIAVSLLWPSLTAAYFRPWQGDPLPFLYGGIGPVIMGWGLVWIRAGFRK